MSSGITIRGMAWDHPRAVDPLEAISADWSKQKNVTIIWDARPLKDFEDQPLEELATSYDLVLIDSPFVGTAATSGLIVPVNDWVDAGYLADQASHTVGPSYASYTWAGKQWALAIDAACQVSGIREDLWTALQAGQIPDTWDDVARLANVLSAGPNKVAIPINPNHAYCAFVSVGVGLAGKSFWPVGGHVDPSAGLGSLDFLKRISKDIHPASQTSDPIAISDRMSGTDEIVYVPLMFGYSSYARSGFRAKILRFGNAPRGVSDEIGSILGGVGIALSSRSSNQKLAADLARHLVSADVQSGIYVDSGGQPGHAAAWKSPSANRQVGNFFLSTQLSMDHAFVRPRVPGHRHFQEAAGKLIHAFIWHGDMSARECLSTYNELVDSHIPDWECDNTE